MDISSHLTYCKQAYFVTFHCKGTEKMNNFTPKSELRNVSVTYVPWETIMMCVKQYKIRTTFLDFKISPCSIFNVFSFG